ncbi:MAG: hypothetical protein QGG02_13410 [Gammaproteobacteria bacterium]|nr:hypothetical protein [Gammaproteobacteria bacterium]MDP6731685.1 hypothetical protein [Gammaproteobacteria bacterium]
MVRPSTWIFKRSNALRERLPWEPFSFTDRITVIIPMTKVTGQLYEYACHEGNYGMANEAGN